MWPWVFLMSLSFVLLGIGAGSCGAYLAVADQLIPDFEGYVKGEVLYLGDSRPARVLDALRPLTLVSVISFAVGMLGAIVFGTMTYERFERINAGKARRPVAGESPEFAPY